MLWSDIGAAVRLDFTATRPLGRSVLISGAVAAETTTPLVPLGEYLLRGIAAPCTAFTPIGCVSGSSPEVRRR
jgi:hypothetical protein